MCFRNELTSLAEVSLYRSLGVKGLNPICRLLALLEAHHIAKAGKLMENDRRLTLRELSASLNISFERTQHIVTEKLQMPHVCARWVPRNLTEEQMQRRVQVCTNTGQKSEKIPNFLT